MKHKSKISKILDGILTIVLIIFFILMCRYYYYRTITEIEIKELKIELLELQIELEKSEETTSI